jgi:lysozyme family protein
MTTRFRDKIMPWIFKWEGTTYENDPDDAGGATKFGIDQRSHPDVNIKDLTKDEAMSIYWSEWIRNGCDHLPPPLDWVYFNCAVNMGAGRASEYLQRSNHNPSKFLFLQEAKYRAIASYNPRSTKYLKGWLARTSDLRKVCNLS